MSDRAVSNWRCTAPRIRSETATHLAGTSRRPRFAPGDQRAGLRSRLLVVDDPRGFRRRGTRLTEARIGWSCDSPALSPTRDGNAAAASRAFGSAATCDFATGLGGARRRQTPPARVGAAIAGSAALSGEEFSAGTPRARRRGISAATPTPRRRFPDFRRLVFRSVRPNWRSVGRRRSQIHGSQSWSRTG